MKSVPMLYKLSHRSANFYVFCSILYLTGCSHGVEPTPSHPLKDPQKYTWTIDTLYFSPQLGSLGQTIISNIWGANDTIVYSVGWDANAGRATMWKYDGQRWDRVRLSVFGNDGGLISKSFVLWDIKGFDANNIYACGESSTNVTGTLVRTAFALHYDGLQWRELDIPHATSVGTLALSSSSQVYCGTDNGQLFTFNGNKWNVDSLTFSPYKSLPMIVKVIASSKDSGVYLTTSQIANQGVPTYFYFLKYKNGVATVIDSSVDLPSWGGFDYWQSPNGTLYSCGAGGFFSCRAITGRTSMRPK